MKRPAPEGGPGSAGRAATEHTATTRQTDVPAAVQVRRRAAASWAQRHQKRINRIFDRLNGDGEQSDDWTATEVDSWRAAWHHLHRAGLPPIVPEQVVAAGRARHCACCPRGGDAS
ncbi:MAG: hypothetical protein ACRDS1_09605 [Pseudonocardiaceae bacterium]